MKKCKYCQSEIDSKAKICPNCRKKQSKIPTWICVLIIIIGIIMVANYQSPSSSSYDNNSGSSSTSEKKKLTLEDGYTHGYDDIGFAYYIEGYVSNPTNKDYSYVQIMFTAYDSEGNTLGSCIDNVNSLEKAGRWKFKAICLGGDGNISSIKFDEITGW